MKEAFPGVKRRALRMLKFIDYRGKGFEHLAPWVYCNPDANHFVELSGDFRISDLEQIIAKMREVQGNGVQESS